MKWFVGSVEEAIREKTANKALLLVHISDGGADSLEMDAIWEATEISQVPVVALRLTAGTPSFQQFIQYYPVVAVPSAYFIGLDGKVVEAVVGKKQAEEVPQFVTRAVDTFKNGPSAAATPAPPVQQQIPPPPYSPPRTVTPQPPPQEEAAASSSSQQPTIEERLERTREIVQQREIDREREDELQRRRAGQDLQKMRDEMEQKEREAAVEERRKQKEADKVHMEKLRKQIEEDRAEKAARFHSQRKQEEEKAQEPIALSEEKLREKEAAERRKQKEADKVYMEKLRKQIEEDRAEKATRFNVERQKEREVQEEKLRQKAQEAAEATAREQAARASVARIQFRLPDGSGTVKQFQPSDKLRVAYDFAQSLLPSARRGVVLSTVITPRRLFTEDDMEQTLADLALAPTAVLLVLRPESVGNTNQSGNQGSTDFFSMLVTSFFGFVASIWAYISGFIFAQPAVAAPRQDQQQTPQQHQRPKSSPSATSSSSSDQQRQTGKVYRLHDLRRDDNADKATWNGNSTNQM